MMKTYKDYIECVATIAKIKEIFRLGYVPPKYMMTYKPNYFEELNCFAHAVCSFPNKILKTINFSSETYRVFDLITSEKYSASAIENEFYVRLEQFGLQLEKCDIRDECDEKSWKVRLYGSAYNDFHLLKQDGHTFSHKAGWKGQALKIALLPENFKIIRNENFLSMLFDGKRKKNYGAYGPSFHIEETEEREGRYVYNVIGDFKITNPNGKPYSEKLVDKIVREL